MSARAVPAQRKRHRQVRDDLVQIVHPAVGVVDRQGADDPGEGPIGIEQRVAEHGAVPPGPADTDTSSLRAGVSSSWRSVRATVSGLLSRLGADVRTAVA